MKYLKIDNNKGLYWDGNKYQEIDKINKDNLLMLLKSAEADDFELDPYDESSLGNKAHQIIYENIYNKLDQFLNDKSQFDKEVDTLYKEAINKYSVEIIDEDDDEGSKIEDDEGEKINVEDLPF